MKLNNLLLNLFLTASFFNYSNIISQEILLTDISSKIENDDESTNDQTTSIIQPNNNLQTLKNTIIDIIPLITFFTAAKLMLNLNRPVSNLVKTFPTITALLTSCVVADQILPNGLNARILMHFAKDIKNLEFNDLGVKKTTSVILSAKLLVSILTYKLIKSNLRK